MKSLRLGNLTLILILLASVGTINAKSNKQSPSEQSARLLDVGVMLFDPNIPEKFQEIERKHIFHDIRQAEAAFLSYQLREALEKTEQWGVVRVIPRSSNTFEVNVQGTILVSNGERLSLRINVKDASGRQWFQRTYNEKTSTYRYEKKLAARADPFDHVYAAIVDDMLAYHRKKLSDREIAQLRNLSRIKFAREFSPEAFDDYVKERGKRKISLKRMVAEENVQYQRIKGIREREHLFIDTLDEHYKNFYDSGKDSYTEWRKATFLELLEKRKLRRSAIARGLLGVASVVGGIAAASSIGDPAAAVGAAQVGIYAGGALISSSLNVGAQAKAHSETIRELGNSFSVDISDRTLELKDITVTLTGTVEDQYNQLRSVLKDIYLEETKASL